MIDVMKTFTIEVELPIIKAVCENCNIFDCRKCKVIEIIESSLVENN